MFTRKYFFWGALFGFLFPVAGSVIEQDFSLPCTAQD